MPALFENPGDGVCSPSNSLSELIWEQQSVPGTWGQSAIIPLFTNRHRTPCGNHRGASPTPVVTRLFASTILRRLTEASESPNREQQAAFRPGGACIHHSFTMRPLLDSTMHIAHLRLLCFSTQTVRLTRLIAVCYYTDLFSKVCPSTSRMSYQHCNPTPPTVSGSTTSCLVVCISDVPSLRSYSTLL